MKRNMIQLMDKGLDSHGAARARTASFLSLAVVHRLELE